MLFSKLARARPGKNAPPEAHNEPYDPCNEESLSQYLHDEPVRGLHLVCLGKNGTVDLYREAVESGKTQTQLESKTWPEFKSVLELAFAMHPVENKQSWAIFTSTGEKLATGDDDNVHAPDMKEFRDAGLLLVMRGGQWLWPGVRIGFRRSIDLSYVPGLPEGKEAENRTATLETLSLRPLVVSVDGFLSDDECDIIQELATPRIQYSGVVLKDQDQGRPASDFRTSQSAFLSADIHPAFEKIDYRTASLVRIPRSHQETVQVLRYGNTEYYSAHNDYFDPQDYQSDANTLRLIQNGKRNRLATVFWYLSDVAEGGETAFPRFNNAPQPVDFKDCTKGLLVKPQRGKVIIFYSLTANGDLDPLSLHGACAVKDGTKWAANKWVWNSPMTYVRDA
jgi:prolyl 4-hydroxylase